MLPTGVGLPRSTSSPTPGLTPLRLSRAYQVDRHIVVRSPSMASLALLLPSSLLSLGLNTATDWMATGFTGMGALVALAVTRGAGDVLTVPEGLTGMDRPAVAVGARSLGAGANSPREATAPAARTSTRMITSRIAVERGEGASM